MKPQTQLVIVLLGIGIAITVWLNWHAITVSKSPPPVAGLVWPKPKTVPAFQLTDHNNQAFNLQRLQDKWTVLFFGYTQCPDICPITLTVLQGMKQHLQQYSEILNNTQFVFVSVDPGRDTLEKLKGYVTYFDPSFLGVTGKELELSELTRHLGIIYIKVPQAGGHNAEHYLIDHSSAILLIDPQGHMVGVFSAPHEAKALAEHYLEMRNFLQKNSIQK